MPTSQRGLDSDVEHDGVIALTTTPRQTDNTETGDTETRGARSGSSRFGRHPVPSAAPAQCLREEAGLTEASPFVVKIAL